MLLLRNAAVWTMAGLELDNADIAISDGKIKKIGTDIRARAGDESIDLSGAVVIPGFIDAHCHIGMWEDGIGFEGADGNESTDPVTPHLRAIDGVNPFDRCFEEAREHGITTVVTGPGSANVIGGQFAALKTYGQCIEDMIIREPAAMKIAFGENPKHVYHEQDKSPMTRMAAVALLREALVDAQEYAKKLALGKKDPDKLPDRDLKLEALLPVLRGELPLKAHAHRADDILSALRVAKEFGCKITIEHCTEGYLIAEQLKKAGVSVVLGPMMCDRSKVELRNLSVTTPAKLFAHGIPFALMTDHPVQPIQFLPVSAAIAVREGLPAEAALRAVTCEAARIAGISDRVGTLEPGKDADIVAFDGHPLDLRSRVRAVFIGGKQVKG